jgi:hypothetical protein
MVIGLTTTYAINDTASHWQTLSCNVVLSAHRERFELKALVVIVIDGICSCKSNYHTITTTMTPFGNNSKAESHIDLQSNNNNNRVSTIKNYRTLKGDFSESRFSIFFFSKHWYLLRNNLTYVLDWSTSTLTFFYFYQKPDCLYGDWSDENNCLWRDNWSTFVNVTMHYSIKKCIKELWFIHLYIARWRLLQIVSYDQTWSTHLLKYE